MLAHCCRVPSITIGVHLMVQPCVLRSEAIVLPFDRFEVLDNLIQLPLCLCVGFTIAFQIFDVFRRWG